MSRQQTRIERELAARAKAEEIIAELIERTRARIAARDDDQDAEAQ